MQYRIADVPTFEVPDQIVDRVSRLYAYFEGHDPDYTAEMHSYIKWVRLLVERTGPTVLFDVGAQFGLFSMVHGALGGRASYAFEPSDYGYVTLLELAKANAGRFRTFPNRVFIGTETRLIPWRPDMSVHVVAAESYAEGTAGNQGHRFDVAAMTSIDDFCLSFETAPNLVKIDIEGFECHALYGGQNTFLKHRPICFLEIHPEWLSRYDTSMDNITRFLTALQYRVVDVAGEIVPDLVQRCANKVTRVVLLPQEFPV